LEYYTVGDGCPFARVLVDRPVTLSITLWISRPTRRPGRSLWTNL